jgi:phosphatidylserine/phosphatidylglycerophosphate/cardiolipin synthase-like enzyme
MPTQILTDRQIYEQVTMGIILEAEEFLWLATADLKDLHVSYNGSYQPFLAVLSDLVERGVDVRLLHAKEPGPIFREDFDHHPNLINGMERILCPRVHLKTVIVDGRVAYTGSANLTGAGMGAKSKDKRNFESGILTDEPALVTELMNQFDTIWMGSHCPSCRRKEHCADYPALIEQ